MRTTLTQPENTKAVFLEMEDIVTLQLMHDEWRRDFSIAMNDEQTKRYELVDKILNQAKQQEFSR